MVGDRSAGARVMRMLRMIGYAALWLAILVGVTSASTRLTYLWAKAGYGRRAVSVRDGFLPVLVVSPGKSGGSPTAYVDSGHRLDSYLEEHPDYTYLVSPKDVAALNEQLTHSGTGEFEMRVLPNGKQLMSVRRRWHGGANTEFGWYVADRRSISRAYCDGYMCIPALCNGFCLGFVVSVLTLIWLVRRRDSSRGRQGG